MQDPTSAAARVPVPGESSRVASVQAPIIPIVARLIRENPGTVSLGQGVVSYGPPPEAWEAMRRGMEDPENHKYRPVAGIPELLEAFWAKLATENGVVRDASRCLMVTAGSNLGFTNAILAVTSPGDEVILQTPYYFNHEMAVTLAGARPVLVPTDARYQLQPDRIRAAITPRTRAVVTISPNNPTGAVYPESDLRVVNRLCAEAGIFHIHDEAYEYFTYDGAGHCSPASDPASAGHTISLFSMSKGFGFASWRIGFLLAPAALWDGLMKIQDTLLICAPVVSQHAAAGALSAGRRWPASHFERLKEARRHVQESLAGITDLCNVPPAEGAFYFLVEFRRRIDPLRLVETLVRDHRVAVVPGTAFGVDGCRFRISYGALTPETAADGVHRLVEGLRTISRKTPAST